MHGAFFFASSNRSRTRDAPTPTNISTKSDPEIEKNGHFASPATAFASNVLPVPGGNDEREQTLNQLLAEMDGFDTSKGLLVLAATNRPEVLDQALLRPGRFDRRIIVDRPDLKGRVDVLKVHAKNVNMDETVDLDAIALATSGRFVAASTRSPFDVSNTSISASS